MLFFLLLGDLGGAGFQSPMFSFLGCIQGKLLLQMGCIQEKPLLQEGGIQEKLLLQKGCVLGILFLNKLLFFLIKEGNFGKNIHFFFFSFFPGNRAINHIRPNGDGYRSVIYSGDGEWTRERFKNGRGGFSRAVFFPGEKVGDDDEV